MCTPKVKLSPAGERSRRPTTSRHTSRPTARRSPTVFDMSKTMQLGYTAGYWGSGPPSGALEAIQEAERLGFTSAWTAEAYGSDALTPLAWWGSHTSTIRLGTSIVQMSARTPAATAMAAMTMDHLSDGRFILGLGASLRKPLKVAAKTAGF